MLNMDAVDDNFTLTTLIPADDNVTSPTESPAAEIICREILYREIEGSRVRVWDIVILIPNVVFLLFLLYKLKKAIWKLRRTSSPIFFTFYGLVFLVAVISCLRCIVSMTVNATVEAGDIADLILWLVLRFFLLATEISVVIFGLAFGHLDSHTSIRRVLVVTFCISLVYSTIQGVLEFTMDDERFHVNHDGEDFDIFGHGGMLFWFTSSVFFFLIYSSIVLLPVTPLREHFPLPTKKSFYAYCIVLAVMNLVNAIGSGLLYWNVSVGLCIVNVTTYLYFTCFAPLVYIVFLRGFFKNSQPQTILFSYKTQQDDDDDLLNLPSQTYVPTKPSTSTFPDFASSFDSTHFVGSGPNPLYDADMPFTGNQSELSINSDYFGSSDASGVGRELINPIV